ncbi:thioredoxin family protein [Nanoarchaeota archaeon]
MALKESDIAALNPGDPLPNFSLKNVDEKWVRLVDFKGLPVAVIFMCNHCPYVKPKMQEIAQLQNGLKGKAVIVCINSNDSKEYPEDSFENMKKEAEKFGYQYYLHDETQEVALNYGAVCTPDVFVMDENHKLIYHGRINNAMNPNDTPTQHDLRDVLFSLVNAQLIEDWFRPSMGCSIKWKP